MPKPRDYKERPVCIPDKVLNKQSVMVTDQIAEKKRLEKDLEQELGDDYVLDLKKNYDLPVEEKYDVIPEIWQGHNIADYIDPDILKKLEELEKEEELREAAGMYDEDESDDEGTKEMRKLAFRIREKKKLIELESRLNNTSKPRMPRSASRGRSASRLRVEMEGLGVDMAGTRDAHFARSASGNRIARPPLKRKREDSQGVVRSSSKAPRDQSGLRDKHAVVKVRKIAKKAQGKMNRDARKGEADRKIVDLKPKHLFSGKRKMGKTSRR